MKGMLGEHDRLCRGRASSVIGCTDGSWVADSNRDQQPIKNAAFDLAKYNFSSALSGRDQTDAC